VALLSAVQASAKTGVIFKQIRTLLDGLLQQKLEDPSLNLTGQHLTGSCCGGLSADVSNRGNFPVSLLDIWEPTSRFGYYWTSFCRKNLKMQHST